MDRCNQDNQKQDGEILSPSQLELTRSIIVRLNEGDVVAVRTKRTGEILKQWRLAQVVNSNSIHTKLSNGTVTWTKSLTLIKRYEDHSPE